MVVLGTLVSSARNKMMSFGSDFNAQRYCVDPKLLCNVI